MAYAMQADIEQLYGADALFAADHDGDGVAEAAVVVRALEEASNEIDSHIGARYPLPLDTVPAILRQLCVDIALYRLALSRDVLSAEMRQRYEDAIRHLDRIARGHATLNLPAPEGAEPGFERPQPIVTAGPERLFSRDKMRGL